MRSTPFLELCLYVTILYFPFTVAEIAGVSGIVTTLMTAICSKRWAEPNLTASSAKNADVIFRLTAHVTETIIFMELGLSVFGLVGADGFRGTFLLLSLAFCLVGRAVNIYPITFLYNLYIQLTKGKFTVSREVEMVVANGGDGLARQPSASEGEQEDDICDTDSDIFSTTTMKVNSDFISWKTAHMLWFSGLRGAVSYGLVRTFPPTGNETIFTVTTMLIVLLTTFVFGGGTETMLNQLSIETGVDEAKYLQSLERRQLLGTGCLHRLEEKTIRKCLIRDFDKQEKDVLRQQDDIDDGLGCGGHYVDVEHVENYEVTEGEHLDRLTTEGRVRNRKDGGLYDFGQ